MVMGYWVSEDGGYHEGDGQPGDTEVGRRPSAMHTWVNGAWAVDIAALITERCAAVDALLAAKFEAGMPYADKILQLREIDQQRIIAAGAQAKFALITGSAWPAGWGWIMADNTVLPLDAAGMSAMADAASTQVQAWIFTGHGHKEQLRSFTVASAVTLYDITQGW
jgi:hypothetical protein